MLSHVPLVPDYRAPSERREGLSSIEVAPPFSTVPQTISKVAASTPKASALVSGTEVVTYEELDLRADQLAQLLSSAGVTSQVPVGLYLDRSPNFVIGALAVLKAGGVYVPLDPCNPVGRLSFMINDSAVRVLVAERSAEEKIARLNVARHIYIGDADTVPTNIRAEYTIPTKDDLAYVIYTSGSTGQPKGVEITHRGLMNLIRWHQRAFSVTSSDHASQVANIGFDAAGWEMWPYLIKGATVHIADDQTRADADRLRDWLLAKGITIAFVPTPMAERLFDLRWPVHTPLRTLLTGGDVLHRYPGDLPFTVVNNYGPTEATVVATSGPVSPNSASSHLPSIGRPIDNTQVYVLDDAMNPVAIGEVGEIYIAGDGIARGYRGQPQLTSQKFLGNRFQPETSQHIYKTGDLGSYLPTGDIAFHGRVDDQVKVNGFRIELDEVSGALNRHSLVDSCVVATRPNEQGENQLLAYVVPIKETNVTAKELRDFLREQLPEYMVPSLFFELSALPLTSNGKIDRRALPGPDSADLLREEFVPATTPIERQLLLILTSLLGIRDISLNDNFFLLGGHSLLGAQLIAKVRETFGVKLALRNLFNNPTVSGMAAEIERLVLANLKQSSSTSAR